MARSLLDGLTMMELEIPPDSGDVDDNYAVERRQRNRCLQAPRRTMMATMRIPLFIILGLSAAWLALRWYPGLFGGAPDLVLPEIENGGNDPLRELAVSDMCDVISQPLASSRTLQGHWRAMAPSELAALVQRYPVLFHTEDDFFACHHYDAARKTRVQLQMHGQSQSPDLMPADADADADAAYVARMLELGMSTYETDGCSLPEASAAAIYALLSQRTLYLLGDSLLRELGDMLHRMLASVPGVECTAHNDTLANMTLTCANGGLGPVRIVRHLCATRIPAVPKLRDEFAALLQTAGADDVVLLNAGLHFPPNLKKVANQLEEEITGVLDAYELAVRRARKKYHGLPYVIWRETTPQHFPGPGGDGQYPAVDYWYMRGACAPHNYSVAGAHHSANYFNHVWYHYAAERAHVLTPVTIARKFAVLRMWSELAMGDGDHVGQKTPHSWQRGDDCTHYCNPSGPMLLMVRLLQAAIFQMTRDGPTASNNS